MISPPPHKLQSEYWVLLLFFSVVYDKEVNELSEAEYSPHLEYLCFLFWGTVTYPVLGMPSHVGMSAPLGFDSLSHLSTVPLNDSRL